MDECKLVSASNQFLINKYKEATPSLIYINLIEDVYSLLKYTLQIISQKSVDFLKYDIYECSHHNTTVILLKFSNKDNIIECYLHKNQLYYMTGKYVQDKTYIEFNIHIAKGGKYRRIVFDQDDVIDTRIVYRKKNTSSWTKEARFDKEITTEQYRKEDVERNILQRLKEY